MFYFFKTYNTTVNLPLIEFKDSNIKNILSLVVFVIVCNLNFKASYEHI